MLYFAYGSNMCTGRLRGRVSTANSVCIARLPNHTLRFHKRSSDGSGKADASYTGNANDGVWGVVFEIEDRQKPRLDRAEGLSQGYDEAEIMVLDVEGVEHRVSAYLAQASHVDATLLPFSWYKRFVVNGARQHGLPADYVAQIEAVATEQDEERGCDSKNQGINC